MPSIFPRDLVLEIGSNTVHHDAASYDSLAGGSGCLLGITSEALPRLASRAHVREARAVHVREDGGEPLLWLLVVVGRLHVEGSRVVRAVRAVVGNRRGVKVSWRIGCLCQYSYV